MDRAMNLGMGDHNDSYRVVAEELVVDQLTLYAWAVELRRGDPARARGAAADALDRWCRWGLPFRIEAGRRLFDVCEVLNFARWASQHRDDPVWRTGMVDGYRRCVSELFVPAAADAPLQSPTRVEIALRREFNLSGLRAGKPLRLGLPLPCPDPAQVDLAVEPVETDGGVLRVSPGHLEVRRSVPSGANPTTAVEIKIAFTAYQERHEIDPLATEPSYPDDATPWLQLSEGMIQVTPAVQALSAAIAGHGKRPGEILARIWAFIGEHIQLGAIHFSDLDPDDPLSSIVRIGWADCFTATALLVGLCRARGVPARMVRGALLYPMTPGGPHYWADVLLPPYGWVPVDTLGWTLAGGDPAATEWVNLFFGRLDYRMKIATLPARRVGLLGIRYPRLWYMVQTPCDGGTIVTTSDVESRQFAFRDRWKVSCGAITSTQSRPQRSSGP